MGAFKFDGSRKQKEVIRMDFEEWSGGFVPSRYDRKMDPVFWVEDNFWPHEGADKILKWLLEVADKGEWDVSATRPHPRSWQRGQRGQRRSSIRAVIEKYASVWHKVRKDIDTPFGIVTDLKWQADEDEDSAEITIKGTIDGKPLAGEYYLGEGRYVDADLTIDGSPVHDPEDLISALESDMGDEYEELTERLFG